MIRDRREGEREIRERREKRENKKMEVGKETEERKRCTGKRENDTDRREGERELKWEERKR